MSPILIDTCTAIWLSQNGSLRDEAVRVLDEASDGGILVYVSPITAWEIGMLVSKDRLKLTLEPIRWFRRFLDNSGAILAEMPPQLLIASNFLPGEPPRDPADRIIAATARDLGAVLMTRDRLLLAYSEQGHVSAVAC